VYRAKLTAEYGGEYVAVKVQRPGVMERIALDTLLMRRGTELIATIPTFSETWSMVLDDWAGRFFQVRAVS
jgi:aarF domain-containing kinase